LHASVVFAATPLPLLDNGRRPTPTTIADIVVPGAKRRLRLAFGTAPDDANLKPSVRSGENLVGRVDDVGYEHILSMVPTTRYFRENVLAKRPYIRLERCDAAVSNPIRREVQPWDGRVRHWIWIAELERYLRVVTLSDGVTVHNAFPDRRFAP
jgi:hypothetical protein